MTQIFSHCHFASNRFKSYLASILIIQIFVGDIMQLLLLNRSFSDGCECDLRLVNDFVWLLACDPIYWIHCCWALAYHWAKKFINVSWIDYYYFYDIHPLCMTGHPSKVYDPNYLTTIGFHSLFHLLVNVSSWLLLYLSSWLLLYKNITCKWKRWHRLNKTDAFRSLSQIFLSCVRPFRFLLFGFAMEGECFVSKQINFIFEAVFYSPLFGFGSIRLILMSRHYLYHKCLQVYVHVNPANPNPCMTHEKAREMCVMILCSNLNILTIFVCRHDKFEWLGIILDIDIFGCIGRFNDCFNFVAGQIAGEFFCCCLQMPFGNIQRYLMFLCTLLVNDSGLSNGCTTKTKQKKINEIY